MNLLRYCLIPRATWDTKSKKGQKGLLTHPVFHTKMKVVECQGHCPYTISLVEFNRIPKRVTDFKLQYLMLDLHHPLWLLRSFDSPNELSRRIAQASLNILLRQFNNTWTYRRASRRSFLCLFSDCPEQPPLSSQESLKGPFDQQRYLETFFSHFKRQLFGNERHRKNGVSKWRRRQSMHSATTTRRAMPPTAWSRLESSQEQVTIHPKEFSELNAP